jgi:hypothetical protein
LTVFAGEPNIMNPHRLTEQLLGGVAVPQIFFFSQI